MGVTEPALHPETPEPGDSGELKLGTSARGKAANEVVLALTRAARSFLLYDPRNAAIRQFLETLHDAVERFSAAHGELALTVRPFELLVDAEVVYLDRDRDRSLAFRLYRDGVRKISVHAGAPWSELLKLLEVLSIRFVGVRQTEDDMVVLLWKAGFHAIDIEAVEGFVPDEEVGADELEMQDGAGGRGGTPHIEAPFDFDLPAPDLRVRAPLEHRELPPVWRDALVAEDAANHLPEQCLRLVERLFTCVSDPADPMGFLEIVPLLREIRDFVLTEGQLPLVLEMARRIDALDMGGAIGRERDHLLMSFADERALARLVHGVSSELREAPADLVTLLELVPGDHFAAFLGVLESESGETSRRVIRSLIERYVPQEGEAIVAHVASASTPVACELLRALRYASLPRAVEAVRLSSGRGDLEFEMSALRVLGVADLTPVVGGLLGTYVGSQHAEVRARALELVGKRQAHMAFGVVLERVKRVGLRGLGAAEAERYGIALAGSDPVRALGVFRDWVKPKGFFATLAPPMLCWVAVSGLAELPGDEVEGLIKHASEKGSADLQRHCTACMVKHRRLLRGVAR